MSDESPLFLAFVSGLKPLCQALCGFRGRQPAAFSVGGCPPGPHVPTPGGLRSHSPTAAGPESTALVLGGSLAREASWLFCAAPAELSRQQTLCPAGGAQTAPGQGLCHGDDTTLARRPHHWLSCL